MIATQMRRLPHRCRILTGLQQRNHLSADRQGVIKSTQQQDQGEDSALGHSNDGKPNEHRKTYENN